MKRAIELEQVVVFGAALMTEMMTTAAAADSCSATVGTGANDEFTGSVTCTKET